MRSAEDKLREVIEQMIDAWEVLPADQHSVLQVQRWLDNDMAPAIK